MTLKRKDVLPSPPIYRVIKVGKGAKRRLYDPQSGGYTTVDALLSIIQKGATLNVVEKNTGRDVTREILLSIWIECEKLEQQFSTTQLRELIRIKNAK